MRGRLVVLVNGLPGTGKTTLARGAVLESCWPEDVRHFVGKACNARMPGNRWRSGARPRWKLLDGASKRATRAMPSTVNY